MPVDESMFVRRIATNMTSQGLWGLWTSPAGKRLVVKGCALRARVTTALVGATPGDLIALSNSAANLFLSLGVIRTATDAAGTDYGYVFAMIPGGYVLPPGDPLCVTTGAAFTGTIQVVGLVWGDEVQAPT
jgi:hypothetical protein